MYNPHVYFHSTFMGQKVTYEFPLPSAVQLYNFRWKSEELSPAKPMLLRVVLVPCMQYAFKCGSADVQKRKCVKTQNQFAV